MPAGLGLRQKRCSWKWRRCEVGCPAFNLRTSPYGIQGHQVQHPRPERGQWSVVIYPGGAESPAKVITGGRERAEALARSMINNWLNRHQGR